MGGWKDVKSVLDCNQNVVGWKKNAEKLKKGKIWLTVSTPVKVFTMQANRNAALWAFTSFIGLEICVPDTIFLFFKIHRQSPIFFIDHKNNFYSLNWD